MNICEFLTDVECGIAQVWSAEPIKPGDRIFGEVVIGVQGVFPDQFVKFDGEPLIGRGSILEVEEC